MTEQVMNSLTFDELHEANGNRCEEVFHPIESWTPTDWSCALAGETGEVCNEVKKLRRGDDLTDVDRALRINKIAAELADVIIYADLLAHRLGINLGDAVRHKFNVVSLRRGSEVRLRPRP